MAIHTQELLVTAPEGSQEWVNDHARLAGSIPTALGESRRRIQLPYKLTAMKFSVCKRLVGLDCGVVAVEDDRVVYDVDLGDEYVRPDEAYFCDLFPEAERPIVRFKNEAGLLVVDLSPEANDTGLVTATGIYPDGQDRVTLDNSRTLLRVINRVLQPQ